jgi:valyl-tRNA synthetase
VLDTWFSSWLWPLSTLGWPDSTPDFERHYPTSVLSTAKDIIFFWVARMNFAGLELVKQLPYKDVYIHPTVLDERGAVMSKSKGNGIDPLVVIEGATVEDLKGPIYEARPTGMEKLLARVEKSFPDGFEGVGADALRFTLIFSCSEGQEARLSLQKFNEIGRRFVTKLWNASRFVLLSLDKLPGPQEGETLDQPSEEDLWIDSRRSSTVSAVRDALDHYDFGPVGQSLYRFVWNDYCDWFLELSKGRIQGSDPTAARQAGRVLGRSLAEILRLLHPIVPFITEELWGMLLGAMDEKKLWVEDRPESELLIMEAFPKPDEKRDAKLEERFEAVQRLVTRVRNIRANARLTESVRLKVLVKPLEEGFARLLSATTPVLCRLANLESIDHVDDRPDGVVTSVDPAFELYVDLGQHVDLAAEVTRIDKEMASLNKKLERLSKKLQNSEFLTNAPEEVVKKERAKDRELNDMLDKLNDLRKEYAAGA